MWFLGSEDRLGPAFVAWGDRASLRYLPDTRLLAHLKTGIVEATRQQRNGWVPSIMQKPEPLDQVDS